MTSRLYVCTWRKHDPTNCYVYNGGGCASSYFTDMKESRWDFPAERRYNFSDDLKFGKKGEELTRDFLQSIADGSFEVKTDRYRNGRMVVETEQNPRKTGWKPSGINVTEASWWVYIYCLDGAMIAVSVDRLKRYISRLPKSRLKNFAWNSNNPSRGFLLVPEEVMDMMINPEYDAEE
jgi:hypothetical protein